ncbi:hypothetical protein ABZ614_43360 [Streptomyces sp. NPDC013178]|uniref:hypothetical protein n=1 Tax=unclassified Streptomyces TaxID=2593676 RepID=UPI0033DAA97D
MKNKKTLISAVAAFTAALAAAVGVPRMVSAGETSQADTTSSAGAHAAVDDRYPSQTAADWIAHTDHAIAYTVLSEKALPMSEEEEQSGEGFVPRELTVRVDKVIWSHPASTSEPPAVGSTIVRHSGGWTVHDGERTPVVDADRPVLEPGHSYIEAVHWLTKGPDGTELPPSWVGLGEGSKLPFDNGVIGKGENEGQTVSATRFRAMEDEPGPASLEEQMAGKSATELAAALDAAVPAR